MAMQSHKYLKFKIQANIGIYLNNRSFLFHHGRTPVHIWIKFDSVKFEFNILSTRL